MLLAAILAELHGPLGRPAPGRPKMPMLFTHPFGSARLEISAWLQYPYLGTVHLMPGAR
jgi:hypothetical protein